MRNVFPLLLILPLFLGACEGESRIENPELFGLDHYPLESGHYAVYDIRKVIYNANDPDSTFSYQRREVVIDTFTNVANKQAYRTEHYIRLNDTTDWQIDSVWTIRLDRSRIIRVENNEPYIKLSLPAREGLRWDGNAENDLSPDLYEVELPASWEVNGMSFSQPILVVQNQDSSLVDRDVRLEVYARDVGLIYKRSEVYDYINDFNSPFYAQDSIVEGFFVEQRLLEYGNQHQQE